MKDLNTALLSAHLAEDHKALVSLYTEAAREIELSDLDAACFFFTQAFVFALEAGLPEADDLRAQLIKHGREPRAGALVTKPT